MTPAALELRDVAKAYGGRSAVAGVSFTAAAGQVTGVLGPNGAGKSTLLRMVSGILAPDSGAILLFGVPASRIAAGRLGYLPEERGLYRGMTPRAAIIYAARLRGLGSGEAGRRADRLLAAAGLGPWTRKPIKALSKGMAQKVQLAAAIAHDPDLVVLDEPFSGLDPVGQGAVEETVRGAARRGAAVVFSTHVMEHAERLCDAIVMIAQGRKAFEGTVQDALEHAPHEAAVDVSDRFDLARALAPAGFAALEVEPGAEVRRWRVALVGPDPARRLLAACVAANAPLLRFEPRRPTLHDAFVSIIRKQDEAGNQIRV